jgi:predicted lipoprotein with Yx(FWY)xxD motif
MGSVANDQRHAIRRGFPRVSVSEPPERKELFMGVRLRWLVAAVALLAGVGVAMGATMSGGSGTVNAAHNSKFGSLLVSATGMTLYHYTSDKRGTIKCTGACATFWPPLLVKGSARPKAGAGVHAASLSTMTRPDGTTQVAYAGLTLYRYSGDKKPGDVKGQGFQGKWFAVTSAGTLAKASNTGGTPAPPAPTTTGGGGYGGYGP